MANCVKDEVRNVWDRIVAMGLQEYVKDRNFMNGRCFNCRKAAATYLLHPCFHLNRCEACFHSENMRRNIKCLLCGKAVTGFTDVMAGDTL